MDVLPTLAPLEHDLSQLPFKHFIQLIGKGHKSARTLTQQEAYQAMNLLLQGCVTAAQCGAFLMLLRIREETPEEIAGFLLACRRHTVNIPKGLIVDLDMGCYAGKRRHLPWLILAVLCLAGAGKRIYLHGTTEPDTKRVYVNQALCELGFIPAHTAEQISQHLDRFGFAFSDLCHINPGLHQLIAMRAELGLRSCANTLARMLNPAKAIASLQGVYHRGLDEKHSLVAQRLGDPSVMVFRGDGGEVEVNPERVTTLHRCHFGKISAIALAPLNDRWVTKPRTLDCQHLRDVWQNKSQDYYGISAVKATLTVMLMALDDTLEMQAAQRKAHVLWQQRQQSWPLA